MEADWEFELGADAEGNAAPVIDACWPGLVDLRRAPELAQQLPEAAGLPALAEALMRLNGADSPVWSCKCDYWSRLVDGDFDPDELDAPAGCSAYALGCYIDLLSAREGQWATPERIEEACRRWRALLRAVPLRCCRVDFVVRRALVNAERMELGITAYLTACGASLVEATDTLEAALGAFADALCGRSMME
ncbi:MAG: hypothetical protein WB424_00725 [Terracidiphilus sp.]